MGESIERKYWRVLEPWEGGHTPFDTGFGNRLLYWDSAYQIREYSDTECFLDLEKRYWNELDYIELPGTREYDVKYDHETAHNWLMKYDLDWENDKITKLPNIGNDTAKFFINQDRVILPEDRYYVNYDWETMEKINNIARKKKYRSGLSRIKVIDSLLQKEILKVGNYAVGIHIRRGNGVFKSETDFDELPNSVQENEELQGLPGTIYKYYKDNLYEKLVKEIKEENPKQKFYISCDLLNEQYDYLKEKLGDNIFSRQDIIDKLPRYLTEDINFKNINCKKRIALESVIDMMVLASCSFVVGSPHSTWLDAVTRISPVPHICINEGRDLIIDCYRRAMKNYSVLL